MKKKLFFVGSIFSILLCIYATPPNKARYTREPVVLASFTEDSSFTVSEEFASFLGYTSLTIDGGSYQVVQNEDGTITASLDLKDFTDDSVEGDFDDASEDGFGESTVGIRLAKRICKRHHKACHCGIGFRCGTTSSNLEYEDGNSILDLRVGVDQEKLKINFLLPAETDVEALLDEE